MSKSVFIADQDSRCGKKISDIFITEGYRVIKTSVKSSVKETEEPKAIPESGNLVNINWDCFSPYSARSIILALKLYKDVKHFIVILSSPETGILLHRQSTVEFQKGLDFYVRSQILLSRNIIDHISGNPGLSMSFVLGQSESDKHPYRLLFKAFITSVLQENIGNEKINVNAFEAGKESPESFADFLYTSLKDKGARLNGKWNRMSFLGSLGMPGSLR